MFVTSNAFAADITLEISTGAVHLVAAVVLDERFLAFVAVLNEGGAHGLLDDVLGG
jgi:hypothetical protein